jgi:hypothetical protein
MGIAPVSVRRSTLLAAVLLTVGAGAPALAQEGGLPLGPALVFPRLAVTVTHDDNIYLTSDNATSDWITTVAPALRLTLPVRRFLLEAEGGVESVTYADHGGEDATNWFVGGALGAVFPGGLDFKVSGRYAEEYLSTSQEFGPGEDSKRSTLAATAGYRVRDALRFELGARSEAYGYDRSHDLERTERTLQADCFWRLRPRTSAFVEGAVTDFDYDGNSAQDGSAVMAALGVTWEATSRSAASAKVGYEWKRYDDEDPALGTEDGDYAVVSVGARHDFTRRTAVELGLARGSHESDFADNPYYLRTALSAGLTQRFTAKIYGRAALNYDLDDYPNDVTYRNPYDPGHGPESGERSDRTFGASVALGYEATRWLTLEAGWRGERRDSNFDTFEYEDNQLWLRGRAAF